MLLTEGIIYFFLFFTHSVRSLSAASIDLQTLLLGLLYT